MVIEGNDPSVNGPQGYCEDCRYSFYSTREKNNFIVIFFSKFFFSFVDNLDLIGYSLPLSKILWKK